MFCSFDLIKYQPEQKAININNSEINKSAALPENKGTPAGPQGNVQGNTQENTQGNAQRNVQGNVQGNAQRQGTPQRNPQSNAGIGQKQPIRPTAKSPLDKQRENVVMTAPKEDLTLMLYDGCLKFINQAMIALENKDYQKSTELNIRAQNIIMEFRTTLDMSFEISKQMDAMYIYIYRRLVEGNMKKDPEILGECRDLVRNFRDTWKEALVLARKETAQKRPPTAQDRY